ncbi:MAG TPA: RDD family protein [Candidatus Limnocylindrales bacterium]|nr:RDD family protein [Candidatus Limnocylindrales bacterium]
MDEQPPAPQPADVPAPPAPVPATPAPAAPPPVTPAVPPPAEVAPPYWQGGAQPAGPAPGVEFAGLGARFVAYLIDGFIAGVIVTLLSLVLVPMLGLTANDGEVSGIGAAALTVYIGIVFLVALLYFPFFWQRDGQTPGMKLFNIRVVRDRDGGKIGWGSAILRLIGYTINSIVFGLPIGWLWAAIDSRRRGWHDLIGGTVVIKA